MKEKVLRDTRIRSMHEMGETKRAQELRVDEVSVQKIRENHETMAQGMGSPRHLVNRRRRTREGPEPAWVQTLFHGWRGTRR